MDKSGRILIVDDEQMVTKTLTMLLGLEGFCNVFAFNNPNEALEYLQNNETDLIISDFIMPQMNGIDFLEQAKKLQKDVSTILLTGYADKENAIRAINEIGIFKYIEKPWDNNNLIINIKNAIVQTKLKKELNQKIKELEQANKKLEEYSKDLEKVVDERTQELSKANLKLNAIISNCADGIILFNNDLKITDLNNTALELFSQKKKELFSQLDLTIITPSAWLAGLVKQSFLKDYPVKVLNNGIDLSLFAPTESDFRAKYGLEDKKIVLGVAFDWGARKGLDVFIDISSRLPENYKIVLVGTNDEIDKTLPENIISIHRTQNQKELSEIYSAGDVFANPTREENFPTVEIESLACGTPIVSFNTGGCAEIFDGTCGISVDKNDNDSLLREIIRVCEDKPFSSEACLRRAEIFDMHEKFKEYINLYV